jgi:hypothetical protein
MTRNHSGSDIGLDKKYFPSAFPDRRKLLPRAEIYAKYPL